MKRALILSSGAAWGAFHIGALRFLISNKDLRFDICAGTGIGAMNAAFVACGEFEALADFWNRIGWFKLISFNWNHPFRDGLFSGKPQRDFIKKHISEDKIEQNNSRLIISSLNISTGKQSYFTYPGAEIPLEEALMAASAVPGLTSPYKHLGGPLVEGTFVNSFILHYVMSHFEVDEYFGVAALPAGDESHLKRRKYSNWRQALQRTLQVNLSRDIRHEIQKAEQIVQEHRAYQQVQNILVAKINEEITDDSDRQKVLNCIKGQFSESINEKNKREPKLHAIISEKEVGSPLWSFRNKNMDSLKEHGYQIAQKIVP